MPLLTFFRVAEGLTPLRPYDHANLSLLAGVFGAEQLNCLAVCQEQVMPALPSTRLTILDARGKITITVLHHKE